MFRSVHFGLGTRIYLSMLALIAISLVGIGYTTSRFFKSQHEQMHIESLLKQEQSILSSFNYFIFENDIREINTLLENKIQELTEIQGLDLNIYSFSGELIGSTHNELFDDGTFPKHIGDSLLSKIRKNEQIIIQEIAGDKEYLSSYFVLYNSVYKPLAIINLPYFKDVDKNKREISVLLTSLIQIYIMLFLGAGLLAYLISNYITNSLQTIGNSIKAFRINGKNQKLEWKGKDEIGELIETYNQLVEELEASAKLLAQSERESAWKEMARQVAHEIKNPLTPMRLTLQHLQRTAHESEENLPERINKVSKTLLEQIDSLSRIASEFSNFAKLPQLQCEAIDTKDLVESICHLYEHEEGSIETQIPKDCPPIFADREQLLRALGNLVKNALQSGSNPKEIRVLVQVRSEKEMLIIDIIDNGEGIAKEQFDKIFQPNFTTKSSGTGLGLAIVKRIIEGMGGDISFTSEVNKGTCFTVSVPIAIEQD
jgi:nitrogen fixation/metabolism regulation signal transduction histidine kinase